MRNTLVLRPLLALGLCLGAGIGGAAPAAAGEAARPTDRVVLSIFGEAGDPVTEGSPRVWHTGRDAISVSRSGDEVRVSARATGQELFEIVLAPRAGEQFTYGGFFDATAAPTATQPTLKVTGGDRSCAGSTGQFRVLDNSPNLDRLWILFEQRCEGATGSSFGEIRVNVDRDLALLVAPSRVEFPQQELGTESVLVPMTLINIGSEAVTFGTPQVVGRPTKTPLSPVGDDPVGLAGAASFRIQSSSCATLEPGASCAILVAYRPVLPGPVEASLVVPDSTRLGSHQMSLAGFAG